MDIETVVLLILSAVLVIKVVYLSFFKHPAHSERSTHHGSHHRDSH